MEHRRPALGGHLGNGIEGQVFRMKFGRVCGLEKVCGLSGSHLEGCRTERLVGTWFRTGKGFMFLWVPSNV